MSLLCLLTVWGKTCLGCVGRALPLPELGGGVQLIVSGG